MRASDAVKLRELTENLCLQCERLATAERDVDDASAALNTRRCEVTNTQIEIEKLRSQIDQIIGRPTQEVELVRY